MPMPKEMGKSLANCFFNSLQGNGEEVLQLNNWLTGLLTIYNHHFSFINDTDYSREN